MRYLNPDFFVLVPPLVGILRVRFGIIVISPLHEILEMGKHENVRKS